MKFLSIRDLRSKSAEVWKGLEATREMVVTSNGRPIAILSAVTEDTLEETLVAIRRARGVAAVSELQRRSIELGTDALAPEEVEAEIAAVRRARRRQSHTAQ
jgi:antitoxin (DNA-binding transcriptional repressor) of toxin-antitoxin stability system